MDIVRSFGPDSAVRIVIEGLPDGAVLTPPPGMTATFDPGSGQWTLAGTIPDAFNLILALPQYFWGDVTMLATVYARDDDGTVRSRQHAARDPVRDRPRRGGDRSARPARTPSTARSASTARTSPGRLAT